MIPGNILGIDPSTYTGICLLSDTEAPQTKLLNFPKETGFQRVWMLRKAFDSLLEQWEPEICAIEGYAYSNTNTLATLVEIGTAFRLAMRARGIPWYTITPSTLKKHITGKGNAKKEGMAAACKEKYGFESKSDDIVDAFALARFASDLRGHKGPLPPGVMGYYLLNPP